MINLSAISTLPPDSVDKDDIEKATDNYVRAPGRPAESA